jgi:hypothetical protein
MELEEKQPSLLLPANTVLLVKTKNPLWYLVPCLMSHVACHFPLQVAAAAIGMALEELGDVHQSSCI